ncbi:MAG: SDR family oxidoreductase [Chloroflexota bacterium]|nr:SDR family oxidoreductase [Chloroflexota bacterium]
MNILEGKTALVTGATHGIGRAIAITYAAEGANVVACGRDEAALASLAAEIGDRCVTQPTDVQSETDVEAAVQAAVEHFGGLDVALNAAGTGGTTSLVRNADIGIAEEIRRTNVLGILACMKHESRAMRPRGRGSIINVSSLRGKMPAKAMAAYCGSKAAVNMMTEVAALELGEFGVRVNAIGPGAIDTRMTAWMKLPGIGEAIVSETPLGRVGQTDDLTGLAVYLASAASSFVTGQVFYADGGASLMRYPDLPALFRTARPKAAP